MGLGRYEEELGKRDRSFDLAMAVLKYDAELRKHPDAPAMREPAGSEVVELQAHYTEMRGRAAAMVREIAREGVENGVSLTCISLNVAGF